LERRPAPLYHIRYEQMVVDPGRQLPSLCHFLGLEYEPPMLNYGDASERKSIHPDFTQTVDNHRKPSARFIELWVGEAASDANKLLFLRRLVGYLPESSLDNFGYPRSVLLDDLASVPTRPIPRTDSTREKTT